MKKYTLLLFGTVLALLLLISCQDDDDDDTSEGNWVKLSDYDGDTRTGAVTFDIGENAYVGLGTDGEDYFQDFWRYDPVRNSWTEVAPFPGEGRISAVAFSIGSKGYVGTGFNEDMETEELSDFWEYDSQTDTWTETTSFGGSARYSAVAFSLGGYGYVGTGYDGSYLKDFWRYDPATTEWTQSLSLFGSKRESAFAFVLDGKAFVGSGTNNDQYLYDFWAFDPESDTWINYAIEDDEADYFEEFALAMERSDAVVLVMDEVAYIATGEGSSYLSSVISFDPFTGIWNDDFTGFEGLARGGAVGFVIDGQGYIATGRSASRRHDDIWAWHPTEEYEEFD